MIKQLGLTISMLTAVSRGNYNEKLHVKPSLCMFHGETYVYFGAADVTETFWCWQLIYVASGLKS